MELIVTLIGSMLANIGVVTIIYVISWFVTKKFKAERKYSLNFVLTFLVILILALFMKDKVFNIISGSLDLLIVAGVSFHLRDDDKEDSIKGGKVIKKIVSGSAFLTGGIAYLVLGILGIIIHLWTILIALGSSGLIAALITFVAPVASQFYWAYYAFSTTHTVFNTYWMALAIYLAMWAIVGILYFVGSVLSPDNE